MKHWSYVAHAKPATRSLPHTTPVTAFQCAARHCANQVASVALASLLYHHRQSYPSLNVPVTVIHLWDLDRPDSIVCKSILSGYVAVFCFRFSSLNDGLVPRHVGKDGHLGAGCIFEFGNKPEAKILQTKAADRSSWREQFHWPCLHSGCQ